MNKNLFKNIIVGEINSIQVIDLVGEYIDKPRNLLKSFFNNLYKWTVIFKNLANLLNNSLSKKYLAFYENLMELEGLKDIFSIFKEKIQSSFDQISNNIKTKDSLINAYNYMTKDFLFVYYCVLNFSKKTKISFNLKILKDIYFNKFKTVVKDNINRALNLVLSLRDIYNKNNFNSDTNISNNTNNKINLENLNNVLDHLVTYIKNMTISYSDLIEEFSEELIRHDNMLDDLGKEFSSIVINDYISVISKEFTNSLQLLNDKIINSKNKSNNGKVYYLLYILKITYILNIKTLLYFIFTLLQNCTIILGNLLILMLTS